MPESTLTITHPSGSPSVSINPSDLTWDTGTGDEPARLILPITGNFEEFEDDTAATNSVVGGAFATWVRDSRTEFTGRAQILRRDDGSDRLIEVEFLDRWFDIGRAAASLDGLTRFEKASASVEMGTIPLELLTATDGFESSNQYPMYPAFSTATDTPDSTSPWISKASARTTTLESSIADGTTLDAFEVGDVRALTFPCFIQIESELIYCAFGYVDGGTHFVKPAERGALGTTGAAHAAVLTVYQRSLKPMSNEGLPRLTRTGARIGSAEFTIREPAHRFDFKNDPSAYTSVEATGYFVYDVDDASEGLTFADVASDLLQTTKANKGPALTAGQIDTTGLDTLFIPRAVFQNRNIRDGFTQLLDELWTQQLGTSRSPFIYWEPVTGKLTFKSAKQQATADYTFTDAMTYRNTKDYTTLYSTVSVQHWTNEPTSLISKDRIYHPTVGDQADHAGGGGTTSLVRAVLYQDFERQLAAGWQRDTATSSNNVYTQRLIDSDPTTGWGVEVNGDMWSGGAPCKLLFLYFTEPQVVDYVEMTLDLRNFVEDVALVELVGITTYTPGDPPTWSGTVGLGCKFHMANTAGYKTEYRANHWTRDVRGQT